MTLIYPGVRLLLMVVGLGFGFINGAQAAGAGRAFPIESENYVIEKFQLINPNLKWDRTNFLTDLSGQYANCDSIRVPGKVRIDRTTPEGDSIAGYNDHKEGRGFHVDAVNDDLQIVIDSWIQRKVLHHQIMVARRFGCSVRPGCSDLVAVNCLFSPAAEGYKTPQPSKTHQKSQPSTTHPDSQPSTTHPESQPSTTHPESQPSTTHPDSQPSTTHQTMPLNSLARAFTEEQYEEAEYLTKNTWDRSHYLENLSGLETSCGMIRNDDWKFTKVKTYAPDLHFTGMYGYAENRRSTPAALDAILKNFNKVSSAGKVGCSLIPDCRLPNGTLYVVVFCIYEH